MNATSTLEQDPDLLSFADLLHDRLAQGVIILDGQNKIRALTAGAEQATGMSAAQSLDRPATLLPEALQLLVREAQTSVQPVRDRQITLASMAEGEFAVRVSAVPLQGAEDVCGIVLLLENLTLSARLDRNVRRLDRLASVGVVSASMAHEIKNALVAVKAFADVLLEKNSGDELAEVVRREMSRVDSIASRMLRFAGPARPALAAVRLHDLLDHSLRMVQHQLESKSISLNRAFNSTSDLIEGDDYQLEQAFVNLFLNALDAMGPNGSLSVTTEMVSAPLANAAASGTRSPHVCVMVADTGSGITRESMNRLFEPFFTTKQSGTGLGLPIARSIVHEHHGAITVRSELNKGTTFSILLPACAPPQ